MNDHPPDPRDDPRVDPNVEAAKRGRFVEEYPHRLKPRKRHSKQQIRGPPTGGADAMRAQTSVLALVRLQDQTFPLLPIQPLNSISYTRLLLDLGPTKIYELIKLGLLDARKLGSQTRITGESIKAFIASLPKGIAQSPQPKGRRHSERDDSRAQAAPQGRAEFELNALK